MQRKKHLLTVLAVSAVAALGLSGCTPAASTDTSSDTVNLLLVETDSTKQLRDEYIPQFEKETGIKVNVELVPEAGMDAKLALSLGSGSKQFDVIEAGAKNISTLIAADWIQPVDEYLKNSSLSPAEYTDGFPQTLLDSLAHDGKTYTMPYQVGADLLFYNKDMFEAAGLDPADPPRTMDEIVAAAKKLTKPEEDQAGFVARGSREGNENSFSWIMMWFLNGGRWLDGSGEGKYDVMTTPEAIKTAEQYNELMTKYAPAGATNYGFAEAQTAMQQGKVAMWLDAAQLGAALEDPAASTIAGKVGYAAPVGEGDDYIVGAVWGFSMVTDTKVGDASWKLIQFLTSKKVAIGQAVAGTNGSPARTDALTDEAVKAVYNPEYLDAMSEAMAHANPVYSPVIPEGTEIRAAISLAVSKIISGQADVNTAMKDADDQIRALLK